MRLKRIIGLGLLAAMCTVLCSGCGNSVSVDETTVLEDSQQESNQQKKEKVSTSTVEGQTSGVDMNSEKKDKPFIKVVTLWNRQYDDDNQFLFSANVQGVRLIGEGFDALRAALSRNNQAAKTEMDDYVAGMLEEEIVLDNLPVEQEWSNTYSNDVRVLRADAKIVSLQRDIYVYTGGAHPSSTVQGYTYDVESGDELLINDILSDKEGFKTEVIKKLSEYEYAEEFFEEWETTVDAEFENKPVDEADPSFGNYQINYMLTNSELSLYFNQYDLGPYAMGPVRVSFPYDEYADYIKKEYLPYKKDICQKINAGYGSFELTGDFNGDNEKELLVVNYEEVNNNNNDDYYKEFEMTISIGRDRESLKTITENINELGENLDDFYLCQSESGKTFLYISTDIENDSKDLRIYDISDMEKGAVSKGYNETGSFYATSPYDSEHIYIESRSDVLGTNGVYMDCYVAEDGQIVSSDGHKYVSYYDADLVFDLGEKYESDKYVDSLAKDVLQDFIAYDENGNEVTVKAGDKLYFYYVIDETKMAVLTKDNEVLIIETNDPSGDSFEREIGDVPESEVIDGIYYAG